MDTVPLKEEMNNQTISNERIKLDSIASAIEDIRNGKVVIVVDDEDRENEGDFICAAECITPDIINFMATHGRGLICAPIDEKRADELNLNMMVTDNTALHETAFTVSIDLIGHGCTTGISAYDRATGIKALVDPEIKAEDFARPGHIFPLRAKTGGVLRRTGHTEATIDLAKLAGYYPAGVLVEILNEDGTMARLPQLFEIAERFDLKIISIRDLVAYRMKNERLIEKVLQLQLPEDRGGFTMHVYKQLTNGDLHFALTKGSWARREPVLVRVHSSTETGDFLGTMFEDFGLTIKKAVRKIMTEEKGVLLYMRHSEKSADILDKIRVMAGEEPKGESGRKEQRDFGIGAQILRDLNVEKIRLLSKTPRKRVALPGYGLEIIESVDF
jgi:3,4-dihydroxy 2-butanone 4-phosphate synthase/GTP cyclohydrolase II